MKEPTSRKRGFQTLSPAQRSAVARAGGMVKTKKGFATLTAEQRSENARKAAEARWSKVREANGETY